MGVTQISELDRALAIMGGNVEPAIAKRIVTCDCGKQIEPQFEPGEGGDAVVLFPLCDQCRAKELLWSETHCENCHCELPRIPLEWGQMRLCGDGCQEAFGAV